MKKNTVSQSRTEWVPKGTVVNGKTVKKGYVAQKGKPEKRVTAKVKLEVDTAKRGKAGDVVSLQKGRYASGSGKKETRSTGSAKTPTPTPAPKPDTKKMKGGDALSRGMGAGTPAKPAARKPIKASGATPGPKSAPSPASKLPTSSMNSLAIQRRIDAIKKNIRMAKDREGRAKDKRAAAAERKRLEAELKRLTGGR
jgi:hypothetical protein